MLINVEIAKTVCFIANVKGNVLVLWSAIIAVNQSVITIVDHVLRIAISNALILYVYRNVDKSVFNA